MIDERNLTKYYSDIANQLDDMIPVEWNKIIMYAEENGMSTIASFYFYTKQDNKIHYSSNIPEDFSVSRDIYKQLLRELWGSIEGLWNEFKKADEKTWYTLTFTLESDWRFNAEFGYELNEEIGDFERRILWAYNEIGLIPNDEYAKSVLERLLGKKLD